MTTTTKAEEEVGTFDRLFLPISFSILQVERNDRWYEVLLLEIINTSRKPWLPLRSDRNDRLPMPLYLCRPRTS